MTIHYYPQAQNINCRAAVAYRAMLTTLRSSVTPTNRSSGSLVVLTDKDRARLVEVRTAIDSGSPLYTKDDLDKQGVATIGTTRHERVTHEESEADIRARESFWRSGEATSAPRNRGFRVEVKPKTSLESLLGINEVPLGPPVPQFKVTRYRTGESYTTHYFYCSWCGVQVEESQATREKGTHRVACREHSLKIRSVRFPESVG